MIYIVKFNIKYEGVEKLNKRKIWELKEKREKKEKGKREKQKAKPTVKKKRKRHPRCIMDIVIHSLS